MKLNGTPAKLWLDTGASWLTISRKLANKIGARKLAEQSMEGTGEGKTTKSYLAWVDKLTIGDMEFHDCVVHVSERMFMEGTDGLTGTSFFSRNLVPFDFPRQCLLYVPPHLPEFRGAATPEYTAAVCAEIERLVHEALPDVELCCDIGIIRAAAPTEHEERA